MRTVRVKTVARSVVEKSDGTLQPFLGLENLEGGTGRLTVDDLPLKATNGSIRYRPGDVLFSKLRPYLAKSHLPQSAGSATSELLVLRSSGQIEPRYLLYVTLSGPWLDWAKTSSYGSKMPRTSWDLMGDCRVWLPSLTEQRSIADFLDAETSRIDRLVSLRSRQCALLEERTRIAMDGVFRDPEYRPTRLKYLLSMRPRYGVLVPHFVDQGVRFIRVNDLLDLPGRASALAVIPESLSSQYPRTVTRSGDVLLSVVGTMGRAAVVPPELVGANIARAVASLRPADGIESMLIAAWLTTPSFFRQALDATGSDTAQPTLGMEDLANFVLSWPEDAESQQKLQSSIEELLRSRTALVRPLTRQSELLRERRQALITAAVTGQFDVSTASGRNVTDGVPTP